MSNHPFRRAVLFGLGGALLGLILCSAVGIASGLAGAYVSLLVGYVVGRAMMLGSHGVGGRQYQVVAVILTYVAVSLSAAPLGLLQLNRESGQDARRLTAPRTASASASETPDGSSASEEPLRLVSALGYLALAGLISPILGLADPLHGLAGLILLFVAIRIAWRATMGTPEKSVY
jgi:hypothetical protein